MSYPHVDKAEQYAADVLAGKVPACRWIVKACERHRRDKKRALARNDAFPYYFAPAEAERACAFIELLPHVKGEWARREELLELGGWQCFLVCSVFGWLVRSGPRKGLRRFLTLFALIPRKNGKSIMAAAIGLYMWCADGEVGAEVYCGATKEEQAMLVFDPAKTMVEKSPDLLEDLGAMRVFDVVRSKQLRIPNDSSKFEPVVGDPGDGPNPHCAIVDEFHEHQTSTLLDTMQTGMLARQQPLTLIISTAGNNMAGPCYDRQLECQKILEGNYEDDSTFILIYTIDETDDWANPAVLPKANPNFGVSVNAEILKANQRQAVLNPSDQNRFRTKHLNQWTSAKTAWMPLVPWDRCKDEGLEIEEFKGEPFLQILDLASKDDIACYLRLFVKPINEALHYYWFGKYYLPEAQLDDNNPHPNLTAYKKWHKQGWLTVTDGQEIDFDRIKDDVLKDRDSFQHRELIYDPWRATQLAQQLSKDGAVTVEVRQTVQNISAPMKELLAAVKAGRGHHNGDPVMRWMMANVVAHADAKDNIYPRKEKPHMKIDGPVALIMGVSRAMLDSPAGLDDWLRDPVRPPQGAAVAQR